MQKILFSLKTLPKDLLGGFVSGLQAIVFGIAFAMLIFSAVPQLLGFGIGLALISNFILATIIAIGSSSPTTIATIQHPQAIVLATIVTSLVASMSLYSQTEINTTVYCAIIITTLISAIVLFIFGKCRWGNAVRFIPFPVIIGFLGGVGWLLIKGALFVMLGKQITVANMNMFISKEYLAHWLPAAGIGLLLWILQFRKTRPILLLSTIIICTALFFGVIALLHIPLATLSQKNWLIGKVITSENVWHPIWNYSLSLVHWKLLLKELNNIIVIVVLMVVTLLLNASGYEIQRNENINFNRELSVTGIANLFSAMGGGGIPGYQTLTVTLLNVNLGARSRLSGILVGLICLTALLVGGDIISFIPKFIVCGILFYLGIDLLVTNLYRTWFLLPRMDYVLALSVFLMIAVAGLLPGVFLGILIALINFAIHYSRVTAIKVALNGSLLQSNVERGSIDREFLEQKGYAIQILRLQNYLFFGNIYILVSHLLNRFSHSKKEVNFLILDFSHVVGLDSSSILGFEKLFLACQKFKITLIFSHLKKHEHFFLQKFLPLENLLTIKSGVLDDPTHILLADDLDHALEWCEEKLLFLAHQSAEYRVYLQENLRSLFEKIFPNEQIRQDALGFFDLKTYPANHVLFTQGSAPDHLYFLINGELEIFLEKSDGTRSRISTLQDGAILGEIGLYVKTTRTATAITKTSCELYALSAERLDQLQNERPDIALWLHRYIAKLSMKRLTHLDQIVRVLLD